MPQRGFHAAYRHGAREAVDDHRTVAASCGISLLPASFEGVRLAGVVCRPLADPDATTSLLLARHAEGGGPLAEAFVALAQAAAIAG